MYVERYLYAIKKYLPTGKRHEVINELRSHLEEEIEARMAEGLDRGTAECEVLEMMGPPAKTAAGYFPARGNVAGELVPLMFLLMRILAITLPLVLFFADTLAYVLQHAVPRFGEYVLHILGQLPAYAVNVFAMVGVIFLIFHGITIAKEQDTSDKQDTFNPENLPKVPADVFKVSVPGEIVAMIFTVVFLVIINLYPGLIGVYDGDVFYPLIDPSIAGLLWMVNVALILGFIISVTRLVLHRKTMATKIAAYLHVLFIAALLFLLAANDVFDTTLIDEHGLDFLPDFFTVLLYVAGVGAIIGGTVEFVKAMIQRFKP